MQSRVCQRAQSPFIIHNPSTPSPSPSAPLKCEADTSPKVTSEGKPVWFLQAHGENSLAGDVSVGVGEGEGEGVGVLVGADLTQRTSTNKEVSKMHKLLTLLLVAVVVVATLPQAGAIRCYLCQGYIPSSVENILSNNKNCPADNFDSNKVETAGGQVCMTMVQEIDGFEITSRSPADIMKNAKKTHHLNFRGYFCNTDYCNSRSPGNAAPATHALCLPLLLLSLLAAFHRRLA
ncbi:hypothetical protein O3P69_008665 [Scylla paramamosain]|uniref:Protein quiver n=1 Tax=Scylla paramamosain TaxID=85552 RepID=A0AAW0SMT5_SCYPA